MSIRLIPLVVISTLIVIISTMMMMTTHAGVVRAVLRSDYCVTRSHRDDHASSPAPPWSTKPAQLQISDERFQNCIDIFAEAYEELNQGQSMPATVTHELEKALHAPRAVLKEMYPEEIYQSLLEAETNSLLDAEEEERKLWKEISGSDMPTSENNQRPGKQRSQPKSSPASAWDMTTEMMQQMMGQYGVSSISLEPWPPLSKDPKMLPYRGRELQSLVDLYDGVAKLVDEAVHLQYEPFEWPTSCRELLVQRVEQHLAPATKKNPLRILDGTKFHQEQSCIRTMQSSIVQGGRMLAIRIAAWAQYLSPDEPMMYEIGEHRFAYQFLPGIVFLSDDSVEPRSGLISLRHLIYAQYQLKNYIVDGLNMLPSSYVRPSKTFSDRKLMEMVDSVARFRLPLEQHIAQNTETYHRLLLCADQVDEGELANNDAQEGTISQEEQEILCTGKVNAVAHLNFHQLARLISGMSSIGLLKDDDSHHFDTMAKYDPDFYKLS